MKNKLSQKKDFLFILNKKFVEERKELKNKYMTNVQTWLNKNIINNAGARSFIREIHILANDDLENND